MNQSIYLLDIIEALTGNELKQMNDLSDHLHSQFELKSKLFTGKELESIKEYTDNNAYQRFNQSLRYGTKLSELDTGLLAALELVTSTPTDRSFSVYRGISNKKMDAYKINDFIRDKGFVSTSLDPDLADWYGYEAAKFRIHVQPGDHGCYMPASVKWSDEHEFLFPPSTLFKIVGTSTLDGQEYWDMIVVTNDPSYNPDGDLNDF